MVEVRVVVVVRFDVGSGLRSVWSRVLGSV